MEKEEKENKNEVFNIMKQIDRLGGTMLVIAALPDLKVEGKWNVWGGVAGEESKVVYTVAHAMMSHPQIKPIFAKIVSMAMQLPTQAIEIQVKEDKQENAPSEGQKTQ